MFKLLKANVDRPSAESPFDVADENTDDRITEQFREDGNPLLDRDRLATQSERDIPFDLRHLAGIARSGTMNRT